MQLYEKTQKGGSAAATRVKSPAKRLPQNRGQGGRHPPGGGSDVGTPVRGGGSDANGSHPPSTPPVSGRVARALGERQFLYIQVCGGLACSGRLELRVAR